MAIAQPIIDETRFEILRVGKPDFQDNQHTTWSMNSDSSASVNNGANGPVGITFTKGGFSLSITRRKARIKEVLDYYELEETRELFSVRITEGVSQGPNNFLALRTFMFLQCGISNVNATHNEDGSYTTEVAIVGTERQISRLRDSV